MKAFIKYSNNVQNIYKIFKSMKYNALIFCILYIVNIYILYIF